VRHGQLSRQSGSSSDFFGLGITGMYETDGQTGRLACNYSLEASGITGSDRSYVRTNVSTKFKGTAIHHRRSLSFAGTPISLLRPVVICGVIDPPLQIERQ